MCGVSRPFVESVRPKDATVASCRTGTDGKTYPAKRKSRLPTTPEEEEAGGGFFDKTGGGELSKPGFRQVDRRGMALTILTNHPPKSAIMGVYRGKGQETGQRCRSGKNKAKSPIKAGKKEWSGQRESNPYS